MITKKMSLLLGTAMALAATPALADPVEPGGGGFASPPGSVTTVGADPAPCPTPNGTVSSFTTDNASVVGVDGTATVEAEGTSPGFFVTTTCIGASTSTEYDTNFFEETPGFFGFANDELESGLVGQTPGQSAYVLVVEDGEAAVTTEGIVTENQEFQDDQNNDGFPEVIGASLSGAFQATADSEISSFEYEVTGTSGPAAMYYTHTEVSDNNVNEDPDVPAGIGSQTTNYQTSGGSSWSSTEGTSTFDPGDGTFDYDDTSGVYATQDVNGNTVGEWADNGVDPATQSETNQSSTGFSVTDGTDTVTLDQDGLSGTNGVTIDGGGASYVQVNTDSVVIHGGTTSTNIVVNNAGVAISDSVNGATFTLDNAGNGTFAAAVNATDGNFSDDVTVGDDLGVTGDATVGGTLGVTGLTSTNGIVNAGNIATTTLGVTSNATVGGTLGVTGLTTTNGITNTGAITNTGVLTNTGNVNVTGDVALLGATSDLAVGGNTSVGGTLGVTGATTLSSTLAVAGATTTNGITNTGALTNTGVLTNTGNVNVTGDVALLGATSDLAVGGNTTVGGTLGVTGATTTNGITNTGALTNTGVLTNTGNVNVTGDVALVGATSDLSVGGNTSVGGTLGVTGATTLSSTLAVTGATTLTGALTANGGIGTTTLSTSGNATIGGTLGVTGLTSTNGIANTGAISTTTLSTSGAASVGTNLTVAGNTTLTGTLLVTGASTHTGLATFNGNIQAGTVSVNSTTNKISGLANATLSATSTEAVTGQQLFSTNTALSALDAREAAHFLQLTADIDDTRRRAFQGVAMGMAVNAAPLSLANGEAGISGGVGVFEGEWGAAIRAAGVTSSGVGLGANVGFSNDSVGGAVGASIKF